MRMPLKLHPTNAESISAGTRSGTDSVDTEAVLTALDDSGCRALLETTAEQLQTASELIRRCEIPRSTTYRKPKDRTADRGRIAGRARSAQRGRQNASEYRRTFDDVTISLDDPEGLSAANASPEAAD